jgi:hypothetical protein
MRKSRSTPEQIVGQLKQPRLERRSLSSAGRTRTPHGRLTNPWRPALVPAHFPSQDDITDCVMPQVSA